MRKRDRSEAPIFGNKRGGVSHPQPTKGSGKRHIQLIQRKHVFRYTLEHLARKQQL